MASTDRINPALAQQRLLNNMVRVQLGDQLINQRGVELDVLRNRAAQGDQGALAEFWQKIDAVADTIKKAQIDDVGEAMKNIHFEFGAADMKYLARQAAGTAGRTTLAARGQEWNRRWELKSAVSSAIDTYHARYLPDDWDGNATSQCAYDLLLFVCGNADMKQGISEKAALRVAQRAMFTGQQICNYVDTGLLLVRHEDVMTTQAAKKMAAYRAFFHHSQPYLGSDLSYVRQSKADAFVYSLKLDATLENIPSDSKRVYLAMTKEQRRAQGGNPVTMKRYSRDGDVSGRIVRSNHFAVLEQFLMGPAFQGSTGINWAAIEAQYRGAMGGAMGATMASALEEFDGRLATEYQALLYRVVKRDSGHRDAAGTLPRLPLEGTLPTDAAEAADNGRYPSNTFLDILGQPNLRVRAQDGGPLPANHREKIARHYMLRAFYTACAWHWFPHSTCCVFLLDTLEHSAVAAEFAQEHTLVPRTLAIRLDRAQDDVAEEIVQAHRTIAKQISDGSMAAISNSLDQRAKVWWRKYRYQRPQGADEIDQPLRAHSMFEGPLTAKVMDVWDSITFENLVQNRYDIAFRTGKVLIVVVAAGGAVYCLWLGSTTLMAYFPDAAASASEGIKAAAKAAADAGYASWTYLGNTTIGKWTSGVYTWMLAAGAPETSTLTANATTAAAGPAASSVSAYAQALAAQQAADATATTTAPAAAQAAGQLAVAAAVAAASRNATGTGPAIRGATVQTYVAGVQTRVAGRLDQLLMNRVDAGLRTDGAEPPPPPAYVPPASDGGGWDAMVDWANNADPEEVIGAAEEGLTDNGQAPDGHLATGPDAPSMAVHGSVHAETQAQALGMDANDGVAASAQPPPAQPVPARRVASDPLPITPPPAAPGGVGPPTGRPMTRAQARLARLYTKDGAEVLRQDYPTREKEALRRQMYDTPAGNTRGKRQALPGDFDSIYHGDEVDPMAFHHIGPIPEDTRVQGATFDLSCMSFATGGLAASVAGGSFWDCGHTMAFGK